MSPLLLAGALLIGLAMLDALRTTLWPEGHAGPLAGRLTSGLHRLVVRLAGGRDRRVNHRLPSLEGPLVLLASLLLWVLLLWAGWALLFSASPASLVDSRTELPADTVDRIYFTGYTLFTLGNGDFSPRGAGWQLATVAVSLTGLGLVTLTVTYILSVLEAVVGKRSFASQVFALGGSAEEFVLHAWNGRRFAGLELQLISLVEQMNQVTEQHRAYPMLHYYHAVEDRDAAPAAVVVLDDALTLLQWGVAADRRPAPVALRCAREAVRGYLDTLRSAHISPAETVPAPPDLARIRAGGIPTAPDEAFGMAVRDLAERRRLLLGLLQSEARQWPSSRAAPGSV